MKWNYNDLTKWIENGCDKLIGDTITKLDINNRYYLSTLPKEIGNLINLQKFNCSHNKLTTLPKEIGNLINLQKFICFYMIQNFSCFA